MTRRGTGLLLVTQDFPPEVGGIQTWALELARAFALRVPRFAVVAPAARGAGAFDAREPYAIERLTVPRDAMRALAAPGIVRASRRHGCDVVLTGHWYVAASALLARDLGAVRRVASAAHGQELLKQPPVLGRLVGAHRRSVLTRLDAVFPVSRYTAELLRRERVEASRIHVVNNGTDPERFRTPESAAAAVRLRSRLGVEEGPLLGTVARLVPRKGIDTVLEALPRIAREQPGVRYLVVGDGPDRGRLDRLARDLGVAERTRFLGRVDDATVVAALRAMDLFVMPVRDEGHSVEGFGLVFVEASAAGKPVIGSRTAGVPDAVLDGETGLLVEPGSADATARAVLRLLGDSRLRERLGDAGRRRVQEQCTWGHAAEAILGAIGG